MTALPPIIPLDDLRVQLGFKDGDNGDDLWLVGAVESVAEAIESPLVAGRWFRTRGAVTLLFDAESVSRHGRYIDLSMGLQALTYLGVAWGDQPDDGTGTYTEIVSGVYLDPPAHARQPGEPASRISLGHSSASLLPTGAW